MSRQAAGASVNIPPRRMDFEFEGRTPRYWYGNDPFLSLFWSTLSALFPEGEQFFVDSVRHYRDKITDPVLRAQVAGFIGQEAMHSKEHVEINNALTALGIPANTVDRQLAPILGGVRRFLPKRMQLAATCALEHFTATMAEQLLRDPQHAAMGHPDVMGLWMWHALEENEHKTVAFDVYEKVGGNYPERVVVMAAATVVFFALTAWWHAQMLRADGQLFRLRNLKSALYLWGPKGLFTRLLPQYLDYYKPGFHPRDHDTDALLEEWRQKLFGEGGMLRNQVKAPNGKPLH
ncbi:MAG: metal-dependent hydrolase [Pseudomonadota bacterium]